eukprot:gene5205-932_t
MCPLLHHLVDPNGMALLPALSEREQVQRNHIGALRDEEVQSACLCGRGCDTADRTKLLTMRDDTIERTAQKRMEIQRSPANWRAALRCNLSVGPMAHMCAGQFDALASQLTPFARLGVEQENTARSQVPGMAELLKESAQASAVVVREHALEQQL